MQLKDLGVFWHKASMWQSSEPSAHSSTSATAVKKYSPYVNKAHDTAVRSSSSADDRFMKFYHRSRPLCSWCSIIFSSWKTEQQVLTVIRRYTWQFRGVAMYPCKDAFSSLISHPCLSWCCSKVLSSTSFILSTYEKLFELTTEKAFPETQLALWHRRLTCPDLPLKSPRGNRWFALWRQGLLCFG